MPLSWGFVLVVTERSKVHTSWRGFRTIAHLRATNPTLLLVNGLPYAAAQALHYSASLLDGQSPEKLPAPIDLRVRDDATPDPMLSRHRYANVSPAQGEGGSRSPRRSMFELLRGPLPFAGVVYRAGRGNRRSDPPLGRW